jgi:hypothetical protein
MTDIIHPPTYITSSEYNETRFLFTTSQKYIILPGIDASEVLQYMLGFAGNSFSCVFGGKI